MYILGISCFYHDSAAAILKDGEIIVAAQQERFSRKKHDFGFPQQAIDFCLQFAKLNPEDLDYIVFYEKPFIKFERIIMSILQTYPRSFLSFRDAMANWFVDKLWIKNLIREKFNISENKIIFVEHHLSHAASTFFCSPFESANIITLDGVGEWTTTAIGYGKASWQDGSQNLIKLTKEIRFPHSIGLLYSAFTAFLGFEINEGEYKVMGMAPYGEPNYVDKVNKLFKIHSDASFSLDMSYFSYHYHNKKTYNKKFLKLFGSERNPNAEFNVKLDGWKLKWIESKAKYYADIAASIQRVTEDAIIKIANQLYKENENRNLCIAGGVGLNSVANGRLLFETPYQNIYVQPAAGDAGGAIGSALYAYHILLGKQRKYKMEHAYLGKEYTDKDIVEFLEDQNIKYTVMKNDEDLYGKVIQFIKEKKVVGWYQGRFEWGPRALGNRSILADARVAEMKDIVNMKIKFREPFRPFAPSILNESLGKYFLLPNKNDQYPYRYMLVVLPVKENAREKIPAVTHVDGSGRLQTVIKEYNPRYYNLIKKFGEDTGVPVVLNTSFNLKGEPIVTTPQDAFNTYNKSGMDVLVMNNFIIEKNK